MADDATPADGDESESTPDVDSTAEDVQPTVVESDASAGDSISDDEPSEDDAPDADDDDVADYDEAASAKPRMSHLRLATIVGLVLVVALAGLTGWLGFRTYQSHQADEERNLFLQVGRQGALNLTTIDWQQADANVQRILDSATGTFYDDFQKRAGPFVEVVKQAQSKSVGAIAEAGLESESDNGAQVLVAVTVKTSNAGAPEQAPRAWRMRISVQKVGDEAKVSNVEFVP
jgi:Mce-associated membrane protein